MTCTVVSGLDPRALAGFLELPSLVYGDDPNWVSPLAFEVCRTLDTARNPYFSRASLKLFVCRRGRCPVSRLAVIISRHHQEKFRDKAAFFGFFESRNDPEAAAALFREAEGFCRDQGIRILEGPFNPNHYSEVGLQTDRFNSPQAFFQPHNPAYYLDLMEQAGFRISARFQTMRNDDIAGYVRRRYGAARAPRDRDGFIVRPFRRDDLPAELEHIREVNNDAFSDNWHFLPLSREEYLFSAKYLSLVTRPDLIQIVEHRSRPAAVLHCVLDINPLLRMFRGRVGPFKYLRFIAGKRRVTNLIIFTVAIRQEYRYSSVYHLLLRAFCRMAAPFAAAETTWLSEDNVPALRAAESLGMAPDKHFAVYKKELCA